MVVNGVPVECNVRQCFPSGEKEQLSSRVHGGGETHVQFGAVVVPSCNWFHFHRLCMLLTIRQQPWWGYTYSQYCVVLSCSAHNIGDIFEHGRHHHRQQQQQ